MKETGKQKKIHYQSARGGRKTASAFAKVAKGFSGLTVNSKKHTEYFTKEMNRRVAYEIFEALSLPADIGAEVRVRGGGINAQAEAVRNAIARALIKLNPDYRPELRTRGFLTRDARQVERKKYGLKKARRAPQWSKR